MHDAGIGYGSINHPVDRDPVCGYVGRHRRRVPPLRPPRAARRSAPEKLRRAAQEIPGVSRPSAGASTSERATDVGATPQLKLTRTSIQQDRKGGIKSWLLCRNNPTVGKDVRFERIRRITGYLVGTMDKWNDAKKAEERDRVKHGLANALRSQGMCGPTAS